MRFTLWNEKAKGFDVDEYERAAKPTVMALSSCWVKAYGGKTSIIYMRLKKEKVILLNKLGTDCRIAALDHANDLPLSKPRNPRNGFHTKHVTSE